MLLKEKDAIIEVQSRRIHELESEVDRLKKERVFLGTKLTLLSYKLSLSDSSATCDRENQASGYQFPSLQDKDQLFYR